jgi:hypothetical protein
MLCRFALALTGVGLRLPSGRSCANSAAWASYALEHRQEVD